jgi:type IV secretory pathway TrbD component
MNTAITIAFAGAWIASGVAIVAWVIAAYSLLRFLPQRDPEYGSRAVKAGAVFCLRSVRRFSHPDRFLA